MEKGLPAPDPKLTQAQGLPGFALFLPLFIALSFLLRTQIPSAAGSNLPSLAHGAPHRLQ